MTRATWTKKIRQAAEDAGTYKPCFDSVIDTLAGILEMRDKAQKQFEDSGCLAVVEHTNKGGATNIAKNPALTIVMDCNAQALQYWRDLGLTPSGLKKINEQAMSKPKRSALAEALKSVGG